MANLLQAIVLFAGVASAADFSHRAHLALKLECVTCHASVTTSTRVEDNNLPRRDVCLTCHESAYIKDPREMALAHFPHEKHVKALTCLSCHKGIDKSDVTSKANFPEMKDCMVCHNQVDIPYSCYVCHARSMRLTPATHGQGWVDAHSRERRDVAAKQSCAVCHGRRFTCAGCH